MFSESDKLQAKLYAQAQIDLDHLADDARKNGYAHGDIQFYSRMFKLQTFYPLLLKSEATSLTLFILHSERKII